MLQMSYEELQSFIKSEAEKNPLITLKKNTFNQNEENYREEYEINIKNWLYQQSSIIAKNSIEKEIIEIFIENLDDNGLQNFNFRSIQTFKSSLIETTNILNKLKKLDPLGIFSKNVEEFITMQLIEKNKYNNSHQILIKNLNLVASYNLKQLSHLCSLNEEEVKILIQDIAKCNPRPVDALDNSPIKIIKADILVEIKNKNLKILINTNDQYEVLLNEKYLNKIKLQSKLKPETKTKNLLEIIYHTLNGLKII